MVKSKKILTTRKKYNTVKKYDRQEIEEFLNNIYVDGYKAGRIEVIKGISEKFNSEEFKNILKAIKGFGDIRIHRIIDIINEVITKSII